MAIDLTFHLDSEMPLKAKPVKEIDGKYICKVCSKLLSNAIQTECGERFCESCVTFLPSRFVFCPIEQKESNYFYDKFAIKEINALEFHCPNSKGCGWFGSLVNLKVHLKYCDYSVQKCGNCGKEMLRKHKFKHECYNEKVPLTSSDEDHYVSHLAFYNHPLIVSIQQMFVTQMELKSKVSNLVKQNLDLFHQNQDLRQQLESVKRYDQHLNKLNKTLQTHGNESASIFQALSPQVIDLKEISCTQTLVNEYIKNLSDIERSQDKLNETYSDLQLSQQILENTSYDGHVLWKISSYKQRSMAAISGSIPALHSAPCYTSRFGYKYCLRLYLNGDGAGKESYISLFFVLMKSDYDSLHKWPFQNKVTFRLRAKNPEYDIVESFIPDKNSSSFIKPIREMNTAAGVPLFAKKSDINENFILDDAIFIESIIDL